jgi:predicted nucleic-acid-binding Zn-ribbon protein
MVTFNTVFYADNSSVSQLLKAKFAISNFRIGIEMARLNIAYDLLQKTKLSANIKVNDKILQRTNQVYFVVCKSCYWYAFYSGIADLQSPSTSSSYVQNCHVCGSHTHRERQIMKMFLQYGM